MVTFQRQALPVKQLIHLTFLKMNRWYFNDSVPVPNRVVIVENATFDGMCQVYTTSDNTVAFTELGFPEWLFRYQTRGAIRAFEDVMLHEILHLKIGCPTHQEDAWIAECERITPLLGLPVPKKWTRYQLKEFPHSLTHSSYYQSNAARTAGATILLGDGEFLEYQLGVKPMPWKMATTLAHGTKMLIEAVNSGLDDCFLDILLEKEHVKISLGRHEHNGN